MTALSKVDSLLDRYAGFLVTSLVLALVTFFFVRLSPGLIDFLIALNISVSVVMLLVTFFVAAPLEIAAFPTIILLTTLFRLALNVGTTRSILLYGDAGEIVRAFGQFVVGGDYVVGAAIFIVLVVIQFVVIAKGAERVAEVSARFTLDAMPGKQAAIDFDMNSGSITKEDAKRRRRMLEKESKFYGSTEGAMKFVKGDAIAGFIMCLVNLVFGLVVGVRGGLAVGEAAKKYTILTIGDGLQAQIPALLMSVAAGVLVTRVVSDEERRTDLGRDLLSQVFGSPKVFVMAALFCIVLGASDRLLGSGMPELPFYLLGGSALCAAIFMRSPANDVGAGASPAFGAKPGPAPAATRSARRISGPRAIVLELGPQLKLLAQRNDAGAPAQAELLLAGVCARVEQDLGITIPSIGIDNTMKLTEARGWRLRVWGATVASGIYDESRIFVAGDPVGLSAMIDGAVVSRLPDGENGVFVPLAASAALLRDPRLTPCFAPKVLERALEHYVRRAARRFVGIQETDELLKRLEDSHRELVEAVVPTRISHQELADVLGELLDDGISVADLRGILEALARVPLEPRSTVLFAEFVRGRLGEAIVASRIDRDGVLRVTRLDTDLETTLLEATAPRSYLGDDERASLLDAVARGIGNSGVDRVALLVQTPQIRAIVAAEIERSFPGLLVIPSHWIGPSVEIQDVTPREESATNAASA